MLIRMAAKLQNRSTSRNVSLLLVSVLLIGLLFAFYSYFPRQPPTMPGDLIASHIQKGQAYVQFGIMIDAGSTGSRVHVFKFDVTSSGQYLLTNEVFEQVKPGLSSFTSDPQAAAMSLAPLLKVASDAIPKALQKATPINLKATAGLRMAGKSQAEAILEEVRKLFQTYPFYYDPSDAVEIMDGTEEGIFSWATINYLRNSLSSAPKFTAAVLDLGGGSTQVAFASENIAFHPQINILGNKHSMFTRSFLGYGLMAGRVGVLSWGLAKDDPRRKGQQPITHPCVMKGTEVKYSYNQDSFLAAGGDQSGFDHCFILANGLIEHPKSPFSEGPESVRFSANQPIFAMSFYFDKAVEVGLIEPTSHYALIRANSYAEAAQKICLMNSADIQKNYPRVRAEDAPFLCMDLCFIDAILRSGFHVPPETNLTLAKKLSYNGEWIDTQWALGATLGEISEEL